MARKTTVDFVGIDAYIKRLDEIPGATERAFNSALLATENLVKQNVTAAMQKHNDSGHTAGTAISGVQPEWTQSTAKAPVGFDIGDNDRRQSGDRLASVFLMYGTKVHGQPHEAPDRELYNAVYGATTRRRIQQLQEQAFQKVLDRLK